MKIECNLHLKSYKPQRSCLQIIFYSVIGRLALMSTTASLMSRVSLKNGSSSSFFYTSFYLILKSVDQCYSDGLSDTVDRFSFTGLTVNDL